ncbi:MAG: hypothetical protein SGBAC_012856 [Bacillariaceae sp.]
MDRILALEQVDSISNEIDVEETEGKAKDNAQANESGPAKVGEAKGQDGRKSNTQEIGRDLATAIRLYALLFSSSAILMFGDVGFKYDLEQNHRWSLWLAAVMDLVESRSEQEGVKLKVTVVVLRGGDPTLIRINRDYPEAPKQSVSENHTISIQSRGLEAIYRIIEVYKTLNQESLQ